MIDGAGLVRVPSGIAPEAGPGTPFVVGFDALATFLLASDGDAVMAAPNEGPARRWRPAR